MTLCQKCNSEDLQAVTARGIARPLHQQSARRRMWCRRCGYLGPGHGLKHHELAVDETLYLSDIDLTEPELTVLSRHRLVPETIKADSYHEREFDPEYGWWAVEMVGIRDNGAAGRLVERIERTVNQADRDVIRALFLDPSPVRER